MQLNIFSPTNYQSMKINWIEVNTNKGSFVIQKGHAPMVLMLSPNKEVILGFEDGSTTIMTINGGILEVTRDSIMLLINEE